VPPGTAAGGSATSDRNGGTDHTMTVKLEAERGTRARVTSASPGTRVVNRTPVQQAMPSALTSIGN
ncbi:hypothetical protein, partial [Novacetimonas hansenii]